MTTYPNWFNTSARYNFDTHLSALRAMGPIRILQVGAFTGDASLFLLENLPEATLYDVDTWGGSDEEEHHEFDWVDVFDTYRKKTDPYRQRRNFYRMTSDEFFETHDLEFDFIYIDGDHTREQVYKDAVNARKALKPHGILAFDDYTWVGHEQGENPGDAIDAFLTEFGREYKVTANNTQMWLKDTDSLDFKVAVYAIALNEQDNVVQWALSAADADYVVLLDTGSTDDTVARAEQVGVITDTKVFDPWRFDVARNAAVDLIPDDATYCIALDLDERLQPGWYEELRKGWLAGYNRPRYKYVWSWNEDGSEGLVYGGDKIHTRHDFVWKHPVHEVMAPLVPEVQGWVNLEIHHHPDNTKSRGSYFPLLEMAVAEAPDDLRNNYYLGREYVYQGMTHEAYATLTHFLSLPGGWAPERARAMMYLADIDSINALPWLLKACGEDPFRREPWVALAKFYYEQQQWPQCYSAASNAIAIKEKPLEYINEPWAWGAAPYDYAAIAAHNMGLTDEAYLYGTMAVSLDRNDQRLKDNAAFYRENVNFSA